MSDGNVTKLLDAIQRGDAIDSDQLMPLVYDELRRLAGQKMAQEASEHTLQPTALVHEAYLRLVGGNSAWENRRHFFAAAAEAMRRILIESARRKSSLKRGGEHVRIEFDSGLCMDATKDHLSEEDELLDLDAALQKLKTADQEAYELVMLRYFGGLTLKEAAESLGVSLRTANRNWSYAKAWLQREIRRQK